MFNEYLKRYRKAILIAKRSAWYTLCQSSKLWSTPYKYVMQKTKQRCELDLLQREGVILHEPEEILLEISSKFFPRDNAMQDNESQ